MIDLSTVPVPGIIGGLGPASTVDYYNGIISGFRTAVKEDVYPRTIIYSVNMTDILADVAAKEYDRLALKLSDTVMLLKRAGADFALIASNTPHVVFDRLEKISPLPLVSIVDATVSYTTVHHWKRVLFTGTLFTMNNTFYPEKFTVSGIECIMPSPDERQKIQDIIFPDLEQGLVTPEMKKRFQSVCNPVIAAANTAGKPFDAVVLGCTEIPLLIHEGDLPLPVVNTTAVHIDAVIKQMLAGVLHSENRGYA
jgi:aspartate racemase